MSDEQQKKVQRVRIVNEGGPGHMTTVTDADTGAPIERVYRVEVTIDVHNVPKAILHTYAPVVDILADAAIHSHCLYCKQVIPDKEVAYE